MSQTMGGLLLVSNFREAISILENLRASSLPGRGMRHLAKRPLVESLRAQEVDLVTQQVDGEFPVLCRLYDTAEAGQGGFLNASVALSRISAFIFRSEVERDQFAGKRFENTSVEGLRLEVAPDLFGADGTPRFAIADPHDAPSEAAAWSRADSLTGAVASVIALVRRRPEAAAAAGQFLDSVGQAPVTLGSLANALSVPDGPWEAPGAAVASVAFSLRGSTGQEPMEALELFSAALAEAFYSSDALNRFRQFVSDVVTDRRARRPQDLTDNGDVLLRALLLVLQRDRVDEVLEDSASGFLPGPYVHVTAAAVAGFREGLARMPSALKQPAAALLGEFAAAIESDPTVDPATFVQALRRLVPQAPSEPGKVRPDLIDAGPDVAESRNLAAVVQRLAERAGLSNGEPEAGLVGTCPNFGIGVTLSVLPHPSGTARSGLRMTLGPAASIGLLNAALSGAWMAHPGSFLWIPEGGDQIELAYPTNLSDEAGLALALERNLDLARRWRSASEAQVPKDAGDATRASRRAVGSTGKAKTPRTRKAAQPKVDQKDQPEAAAPATLNEEDAPVASGEKRVRKRPSRKVKQAKPEDGQYPSAEGRLPGRR